MEGIPLFQHLDDKMHVSLNEKQVWRKLSTRCFEKKETSETAKETFLLPFLECREIFFLQFSKFHNQILQKNVFGNHYNFLFIFNWQKNWQ